MSESRFKIFSSDEFGLVRTVRTADGKIFFCGADVMNALGYGNAVDALLKHCREKGIEKYDVIAGGRVQKTVCIDEGNVYSLIAHSRIPNAERFEAWIFDNVLPEIRQADNNNADEAIFRAVTLAVSETVKALMPFMQSGGRKCRKAIIHALR